MSIEEFSNEFDTLMASYISTLPFGIDRDLLTFDEYEKSVFLTKAEEDLVVSYYSPTVGSDSFETSEETRRYLDGLVIRFNPSIKPGRPLQLSDSFKHTIYLLPENIWFIVYEQAIYGDDTGDCYKGVAAEVVPVTHDAYYRTRNNPFRGPSRRRVLRLDSGFNTVELVSVADIGTYEIDYLKRPDPIILADLDGLTINGQSEKQTCKLNTSLHRKILELAVQMAISSRVKQQTKQ